MIKLGIVVAEYNRDITSKMEKAAESEAKKLKCIVKRKFYVHGVLDVPLAADYLLRQKNIDAVVVVGAILQGETHHDIVVADVATRGISQVVLKYGKPVGWGISGPRQTKQQAEKRADDYSRQAVRAAVQIKQQMRPSSQLR